MSIHDYRQGNMLVHPDGRITLPFTRYSNEFIPRQVDTCKCEIKLVRESTESAKKRLGDAETALSLLLEKAVSDKDELANAK